jgi:RNA polymerase sigma factor (sigma-70 family)
MATSRMSEAIQHLRRGVLLQEGAGLTDGQLLGCFIEHRDEAAFAALVRRHGPMVWGVCRRLLNHHDAEDAFQAAFLVLVRKAASVVPGERVANWLYGVAHQAALQARRTATRRGAREKQVTAMPEPAVAEQVLWRDLQPLLDQQLSRLSDAHREVIVLCDLEGKTRKEAARHLGLPEGTVGSRLARARAMLAKRLARHGLAMSGVALAAVLSLQAASAGVPTSVVFSTIKAASVFAAATAVSPAEVAALTEGVLRAMLVNKLKTLMGGLLVLAVCLCGIGTAVGTGQQDKKAESVTGKAVPKATVEQKLRERLQGTWKCVYYHYNGVKSEPDLTITFKGNRWESKLDGKVNQSGTFRLGDLDTSPKQIDLVITFSVVNEEKGRTCSGIFMLDGDALCYCSSDAAKQPRPQGFITQEDDGCCAGLYRRADVKKDR